MKLADVGDGSGRAETAPPDRTSSTKGAPKGTTQSTVSGLVTAVTAPLPGSADPGGSGSPRMVEIALAHAANGYHIHPLVPGQKVPLLTDWQHQATTDPEQIGGWWATWPDANIGIATGPSGIVASDLDVKNGCRGSEAWDGWTSERDADPGVLAALTPTGGRHRYYRTTEELKSSNAVLPGVDVKASGGNLVAPGSRLIPISKRSGGMRQAAGVYTNPEGGFSLPPVSSLPQVPPTVAALFGRRGEPTERHAPAVGDRGVAAALVRELLAVAQEREGSRNDRLNKAALNLGQLVQPGGLPEGLVHDSLIEAGLQADLGFEETRATAESGLRAGMARPRSLATSDADWRSGFVGGGSFVFDTPVVPVPVWGRGEAVLWAEGEPLLVAGVQGTGKTTIGQQLALGRAGVPGFEELLGYPVAAGARKVLYLASDRPRQAARSLRRMIGADYRELLDRRFVTWPGPPPLDLAKHPERLVEMCQSADADTVVVDSLKDAFIGLTDDEAAAGWNRARQLCIAAGVEVLELHHIRKTPVATGKSNSDKPKKLGIDEIYGSTWITSGCGSVMLLAGEPGDPVVSLRHVKQPAAEVGPLTVHHDHTRGRSTIYGGSGPLVDLGANQGQITVKEAAARWFRSDKPNDIEKARRRLNGMVNDGLADKGLPGEDGRASVYRLTAEGWKQLTASRATNSEGRY